MHKFSKLYHALDKDPEDLGILEDYLQEQEPDDAAWAVWLLSGKRGKRAVQPKELKRIVSEATGLPMWLVEESQAQVGDLSEAAALLVQDWAGGEGELSLATLMAGMAQSLRDADQVTKSQFLQEIWGKLGPMELLPFLKLLSGNLGLQVEISHLAKVLATKYRIHPAILAHRLVKDWHPSREGLATLLVPLQGCEEGLVPHPFLEGRSAVEDKGDLAGYEVFWQEKGERAQLLKSGGEVLLWSFGRRRIAIPGDSLQTARHLPDRVALEGMWTGDGFSAYHVHSPEGLELPEGAAIRMARTIQAGSWEELQGIHAGGRKPGISGIFLKQGNHCVPWNFEPLVADFALVGAKPSSGEWLDTYSLAARDGGDLAVVAEVKGGLPEREEKELDRHLRENAVGKFGPLLTVAPERVYRVEFEGVKEAPRRKSGMALEGAKFVSWEQGKGLEDVVSLEELRKWLPETNKGGLEQAELGLEF